LKTKYCRQFHQVPNSSQIIFCRRSGVSALLNNFRRNTRTLPYVHVGATDRKRKSHRLKLLKKIMKNGAIFSKPFLILCQITDTKRGRIICFITEENIFPNCLCRIANIFLIQSQFDPDKYWLGRAYMRNRNCKRSRCLLTS